MGDAGGTHGGLYRPSRIGRELLVCSGVLVVAVGLEVLVAWFIDSNGVFLSGDEPTYIIQAQAFLHLSPQILSVVKADISAHAISLPANAHVSSVAESFIGPHGRVGLFEPGMGLLLMLFVATGSLYHAAVVGVLVVNTAGLILIHRRATMLTSLGRRGQVFLAVMLAAPALLIAISQIYPDLFSGVLIACAILEIAIVERTGKVTWCSSVVVAGSIAYLPWLQVKNFAPAILLLAAFGVAVRRSRCPWRFTAIVGALGVVSWFLLLAYNLWYFNHLLGFPEPPVHVTATGVEYTLGLLFGRDQGLFVQVPFTLIGVVGLWLVRKQLPIAVIATVSSLVVVLVLNGTYIVNPYGGGSLAGRFMWTLIPALIAWAAVVLARWERAGRRLLTPAIVFGGVWIYQAIPILIGEHNYFNVFAQLRLWDPPGVSGWWPGLDRVLPQFDLPGQTFGTPAFGLSVELAIAAVVIIAACQYSRSGTFARLSLVTMGALGLVVAALCFTKPLLPTTTLSYDAAQVGAPVVGGDQPVSSTVVPLQVVLPGTYRLTLSYHLGGPTAAGSLVVSCNPTHGTRYQSVSTVLHSDTVTASVVIRCAQYGLISSQLTVTAHSQLDVTVLQLQKTVV